MRMEFTIALDAEESALLRDAVSEQWRRVVDTLGYVSRPHLEHGMADPAAPEVIEAYRREVSRLERMFAEVVAFRRRMGWS